MSPDRSAASSSGLSGREKVGRRVEPGQPAGLASESPDSTSAARVSVPTRASERARSASADVCVVGSPPGEVAAERPAATRRRSSTQSSPGVHNHAGTMIRRELDRLRQENKKLRRANRELMRSRDRWREEARNLQYGVTGKRMDRAAAGGNFYPHSADGKFGRRPADSVRSS